MQKIKATLGSLISLFATLMLSGCSNQKIVMTDNISPEKPLENQLADNSRLSNAFEIKGQVQQNIQQSQDQENQHLAQQMDGQSENNAEENSENLAEKSSTQAIQADQSLLEKYKRAILITNMGEIEVELFTQESPKTASNFFKLAEEGFYDGTKFHRVIKDFMIQGGDPNSKDDDWSDDGQGGPGYKFEDEINDKKLVRGSLAMANSGPDTNGSQFFIVTAKETPHLDGKHTNFGRVVAGMDVVNKIEDIKTNENDHPTEDVVIEKIELVER